MTDAPASNRVLCTDDRFAAIRSNIALALRRIQKELSKQSTCSCCAAQLTRPARCRDCRHVLCEACVEKTVRASSASRDFLPLGVVLNSL